MSELLVVDDEQRKTSTFDELFAFDRTISRLLEMQSIEYVKTSLEKHTQGKELLRKLLADVKARHDSEDYINWTIRKLWQEYRIGTVDEVQYYLTWKTKHSLNLASEGFDDQLVAGERKQAMHIESFRAFCTDLADLLLADMSTSNPKSKEILKYMKEIDEILCDKEKRKASCIIFSTFSDFTQNLLGSKK